MDMLKQIDADIADYELDVKHAEALSRLGSNPDFKLIITDGYLREEAINMVLAKGQQGCQDPVSQARITSCIDAIGVLGAFLNGITAAGYAASDKLAQCNLTRAEIIQEDS